MWQANCVLQAAIQMISEASAYLQSKCTSLISRDLQFQELSAGFLCGQNLTSPHIQGLLQNSGLIHLIVVSGAHLQLIIALITGLTPKHWQKTFYFSVMLICFLIFYSLCTGFQPPIVRALIMFVLIGIANNFKLALSSNKSCLLSGAICLLIFPDWIHNFSFYLSWLVSMILCLPSLSRYQAYGPQQWIQKLLHLFLQNLFVQILLIIPFGNFSWTGLICNFFLAPALGVCMLPISILSTLGTTVSPLSDWGWRLALSMIENTQNIVNDFHLASNSPLTIEIKNANSWLLAWLFIAGLHAALEHLYATRFRRQISWNKSIS